MAKTIIPKEVTDKERLQCLVGLLRDRQTEAKVRTLIENTFLIEMENELMDFLIAEQITTIKITEAKEAK